MNIFGLVAVLVAFAVVQAIAHFSAQSVLGKEVGWKVNSLVGLGCMLTIWGPVYAGLIAKSFILWIALTACCTSLVVYGYRRREAFQISIQQGLLVFWRITARLLITAAVVGAIVRVIKYFVQGVQNISISGLHVQYFLL